MISSYFPVIVAFCYLKVSSRRSIMRFNLVYNAGSAFTPFSFQVWMTLMTVALMPWKVFPYCPRILKNLEYSSSSWLSQPNAIE